METLAKIMAYIRVSGTTNIGTVARKMPLTFVMLLALGAIMRQIALAI